MNLEEAIRWWQKQQQNPKAESASDKENRIQRELANSISIMGAGRGRVVGRKLVSERDREKARDQQMREEEDRQALTLMSASLSGAMWVSNGQRTVKLVSEDKLKELEAEIARLKSKLAVSDEPMDFVKNKRAFKLENE